jgi:hypothetical protein
MQTEAERNIKKIKCLLLKKKFIVLKKKSEHEQVILAFFEIKKGDKEKRIRDKRIIVSNELSKAKKGEMMILKAETQGSSK